MCCVVNDVIYIGFYRVERRREVEESCEAIWAESCKSLCDSLFDRFFVLKEKSMRNSFRALKSNKIVYSINCIFSHFIDSPPFSFSSFKPSIFKRVSTEKTTT